MDRFKVRIGVIGISSGAGESFVAGGLNYYLNEKDAPKVFVSKPEKYEIIDGPSDLTDLDVIVGVIDPLPSRMEEGAPRFAVLSQRDNVIWLVNKDNPGVNHRELRGFLELEPSFSQEALPYEKICRAGYNCEKVPEMYELTGIEKLADHIRKLC
ncbi:MAG: hypothetical protein IKS99_05795 [Firmicutes bacterium]|nr:hypothetical protein [Bacillota bacterium]